MREDKPDGQQSKTPNGSKRQQIEMRPVKGWRVKDVSGIKY
jgi:hypothetical protein